ncbi:MAG TPA: phosphatase PAP2 family protein [Dehalococcoidia bacterium]|nr:phosphatase PAP2 family protein [Dehalococcoidia bacterium]
MSKYLNNVKPSSLAREIALILGAYIFYFLVRGLTQGDRTEAVNNARTLIKAEQALGILWEPAMQAAIIGEHSLVTLFNWVYVWGHWPFIGIMALFLFVHKPDTYRLLRNAFFISGAIGLIIFMTFPVAPPRLVDYSFVDTVKVHSAAYRVLQPSGLVNQYAAVPSFHFGWNMLIGVVLLTQFKPMAVKLLGLMMPAFMFFAIVLTANHYILDAVIGGTVAIMGLVLAGTLREAQRQGWLTLGTALFRN